MYRVYFQRIHRSGIVVLSVANYGQIECSSMISRDIKISIDMDMFSLLQFELQFWAHSPLQRFAKYTVLGTRNGTHTNVKIGWFSYGCHHVLGVGAWTCRFRRLFPFFGLLRQTILKYHQKPKKSRNRWLFLVENIINSSIELYPYGLCTIRNNMSIKSFS